ncbi:hypothetical protein [Aquibacillus salsiterrae]|uniref:ABC transporter periplasmic binding protein yphF n=1 Tax=Aquibacillus salsiterrae TaxID=2950439 RepID=A0A9X3WDE6_9BACI|nr:hypothetical protein [Aquibacillus salsiterrae]MDC3415384.1 hypothetical protein [Aquibacillus salsiterrae]
MKRLLVFLLPILALFLLTGCLYPSGNLAKNQVPNDVQLESVQDAVDRYVEKKQGLVPIFTKENDTPIFQKYIIDFTKLKQENVIANVPGNAFEYGGPYQYVLIYPEDDPTVKIIDLRITEKIRRIYNKINVYRSEQIYPPFGEEVTKGVYKINKQLLGLETDPFVVSPYSGKNLPIVMDVQGNLFVDYRMDLYEALNNFEHNLKEGDDIRYLLADNYPFVPAYSLPYTVKDGEPVFMLPE